MTAQIMPLNMIIPPLLIAFIFLIIDEFFCVHSEERSIYFYHCHVSGSKKVLLRCGAKLVSGDKLLYC